MKLGIIAAGEGTRLRQGGVTVPKPLLPIGGVPMIERIIRTALRWGFREIVCVVNDQNAPQCAYLVPAYQRGDVRVTLIARTTPSSLHSFGALLPLLKGEEFCLATTDTVFAEKEFGRFLARARQRREEDGLLALTRYVDDERPLYAEVDEGMRILRFSDVPDRLEWVTGGLYFFSPRVLDLIEPALRAGTQRLRNFLRLLLDRDLRLFGFPFSRIIDVDDPADIVAAEELVSDEQRTGADL